MKYKSFTQRKIDEFYIVRFVFFEGRKKKEESYHIFKKEKDAKDCFNKYVSQFENKIILSKTKIVIQFDKIDLFVIGFYLS